MAKSVRLNGGRRFTVALRAEKEGGYSVQCLELPQAISQGETRKEALANIKEAIELVLDHLKDKERTKKAPYEIIRLASRDGTPGPFPRWQITHSVRGRGRQARARVELRALGLHASYQCAKMMNSHTSP